MWQRVTPVGDVDEVVLVPRGFGLETDVLRPRNARTVVHLARREPAPVAVGRLLTAREAARYVGCHPNTIYDAAKAGRLRCRRVGRLVRFSVADLDSWTRGEAS